jgi:hypothetical protein
MEHVRINEMMTFQEPNVRQSERNSIKALEREPVV